MPKTLWKRTLAGLVPAEEAAEDQLHKWKIGDSVMIDAKRPRNPKQHRLFWALAKIVADNSERFTDAEDFKRKACIFAEWYDEEKLKDGRVLVIPKSTAFASMGQDDFEHFFNRALHLAHLVIQVDKPTLLAEVQEIAS